MSAASSEAGRAGGDPRIVAVVAMARDRVIGADGAMPWHVPSDLQRYRQLTMGKPMIMGRRTLQSIGRVLDGRDTIVLTRSETAPLDGAILAGNLDEAVLRARECARTRGADEIVIAGGAEVYAALMERTERLHVTEIDAEVSGDTVFPSFDRTQWALIRRDPWERGPRDSARSRFTVYERRSVAASGHGPDRLVSPA